MWAFLSLGLGEAADCSLPCSVGQQTTCVYGSQLKTASCSQSHSSEAASLRQAGNMIVAFLLLGLIAAVSDGAVRDGAVRLPRRGAFAQAPSQPESNPNLVEGDIAVPAGVSGGSTQVPINSFINAKKNHWPKGRIRYRIECDSWEGVEEPVFTDDQIANITQALDKIKNGVPCVGFE